MMVYSYLIANVSYIVDINNFINNFILKKTDKTTLFITLLS